MLRKIFTLMATIALTLGLAFPVIAAPPRLPDLIIDTYYYWSSPPYASELTFAADDCAVQEGAVFAGTHKLLRFPTVVANIGTANLILGRPQANDPDWTFSPCHQHWHFVPFAVYRLLDYSGNEVGIGHKQAFCIEDGNPYREPFRRAHFTCERQGLSVNWEDAYFANLPGQWIMIDDVPPGNYLLSIEVNYAGALTESNYANNSTLVPVTIP